MSTKRIFLSVTVFAVLLTLLILFFTGVFSKPKTIIETAPNNNGNLDGQLEPKADCVRAGCSGELCVKAELADQIATTCEYRVEYGCYQDATCTLQEDGSCGFTQTPELLECLRGASSPPILPQ